MEKPMGTNSIAAFWSGESWEDGATLREYHAWRVLRCAVTWCNVQRICTGRTGPTKKAEHMFHWVKVAREICSSILYYILIYIMYMYIIHAFIHVHFRNNLFQATSKRKTSFIEKCVFSCSGRQILGPMVSAMADIELTQKKCWMM